MIRHPFHRRYLHYHYRLARSPVDRYLLHFLYDLLKGIVSVLLRFPIAIHCSLSTHGSCCTAIRCFDDVTLFVVLLFAKAELNLDGPKQKGRNTPALSTGFANTTATS
ncbi:hypothetical protein EVAR_101637_1 [Eumeta japonica]|uniref:Uncharacterized protein n=1 Tax=Eumeta variegata TaxID=151549 RepID=A0A4C2A8Z8_EUMVA|nr:hypothetical protein EVAR_101637_1 [Eumeta japonica]